MRLIILKSHCHVYKLLDAKLLCNLAYPSIKSGIGEMLIPRQIFKIDVLFDSFDQ